jgi:type I restriction enzyme S subunit
MSFPRYSAYKDSGAQWLGSVPEHWRVDRLKRNLSLLTEKSNSKNNPVALENIEGWSGRFIASETEFEGDGVQFDTGDILFGKLRPYLAKVLLAPWPGEAVGDFHVLRAKPDVLPRFTQYLMLTRSFIDIVDGSTFGSKMPRAGWDFVGDMHLPIPSFDEQKIIAGFLDRETAKIDALVAEQEQLITLLKEKRQAVISHAVTKGLDPSVPMKDSGVEWLGEVPAHWDVRQVRGICSFLTSGPRGWSERVGEAGALFVQSGDLTADLGIEFEQVKRVVVQPDAETARTRLVVGDVVVCITGAKTGNVAVCSAVEEDAYINQHLCLIRPINDVLSRYLGVYLKSDAGQRYFGIAQYGLKQGLSLENIKSTPVAVPPVSEQAALVAAIDRATVQLDQLIGEAVLSIELLRERRSALISAAVTGQIDVRQLV